MSGRIDVIEILRTANPVPLDSIDTSALPSAAELRASMRAVPTAVTITSVEASDPDGRRRRPKYVAAAAVLVAGVAALGIVVRDRQHAANPVTTTITVPATSEADPPVTSGGMWPQSSVEEVREAQELADAGDPAYTWQVDPRLSSEDGEAYFGNPAAEIVERFLREELGWEAFVLSPYDENDASGGVIAGVMYLRCAAGETNPLYPTTVKAATANPSDDVSLGYRLLFTIGFEALVVL